MNKDAEAEINSLLESCPDMYDAMRKAMEWAYRDAERAVDDAGGDNKYYHMAAIEGRSL